MKSQLATSCLVIGCLLGPVIAHAEDSDKDRTHPMTFVKDSDRHNQNQGQAG